MKIKKWLVLCLVVIVAVLCCPIATVSASSDVYLGGFTVGFNIKTKGLYVIGLSDVISTQGLESPSKSADITIGDILLEIDGKEVNSVGDVECAVENGGNKVLTLRRNGDIINSQITPVKDLSGHYRLGLFLRDTVNGIGTVTYIHENELASLGHPVLSEDGELLEIRQGNVCASKITGVMEGKRGRPGALHGTLYQNKPIATINKNCNFGVYADLDVQNIDSLKLNKIAIGEAKMGRATIFSTIDDEGVKEFEINIIKADVNDSTNKNLVIKILDERLMESTGGIVQGMSGSPIVQDGKLVGAVTHVFINDPTRGFGVSINNMLNNQ